MNRTMNDDIDTLRRRPHGLLEHLRRQTDDTSKAWADWVEAQIFPSSNPTPPARWRGGGSTSSFTFWRRLPTPAVVNFFVEGKKVVIAVVHVSEKVLTVIERTTPPSIMMDHAAGKIEDTLDELVEDDG